MYAFLKIKEIITKLASSLNENLISVSDFIFLLFCFCCFLFINKQLGIVDCSCIAIKSILCAYVVVVS